MKIMQTASQCLIFRTIDFLISLIMLAPTSRSLSLGYLFLKQDAHDHMLLSRACAPPCARAGALAGACALSCVVIMRILQILQNWDLQSQAQSKHICLTRAGLGVGGDKESFYSRRSRSEEMSLWVFSRVPSVRLVAIRVFLAPAAGHPLTFQCG